MSSGSTDSQVGLYGPAGFAAAIVNLVVLEFLIITSALLMYFPALFVIVPALAINAIVAYILTKADRTAEQVGRGMLIACAVACLTPFVIAAVVLIGWAISKVA
jgi:hypothetical protein